MMKGNDPLDRKALIQEAYRIDGIGIEECRSIFLDWALSLKEAEPVEAIPVMLDRYAVEGHPMTEVLQAGLEQATAPRRRGGARGRRQG